MAKKTHQNISLQKILAWQGKPLELTIEPSGEAGVWTVTTGTAGFTSLQEGSREEIKTRLNEMLRHQPQQYTIGGEHQDTIPFPETGHVAITTYGEDSPGATTKELTTHLRVGGEKADAHVSGVLWVHPKLRQPEAEVWMENKNQKGPRRSVARLTVRTVPSITVDEAIALIGGPEHAEYDQANRKVENQSRWMTDLATQVYGEDPPTSRTIYGRQRIGDARELQEEAGLIPCTVHGIPVTTGGLTGERTLTASVVAGLEQAIPGTAAVATVIKEGSDHRHLTVASYTMDDQEDVTRVTINLLHPPHDGPPEITETVIQLVAGGTWPKDHLVTTAPGANLTEKQIRQRLATIYARDAQEASKDNAAALTCFAQWTANEAKRLARQQEMGK